MSDTSEVILTLDGKRYKFKTDEKTVKLIKRLSEIEKLLSSLKAEVFIFKRAQKAFEEDIQLYVVKTNIDED